MKITCQDGLTVTVMEIEMKGNVIFGILNNPNKKVELGRYGNLKRACEVVTEITYIGWSSKKGAYEMPAK